MLGMHRRRRWRAGSDAVRPIVAGRQVNPEVGRAGERAGVRRLQAGIGAAVGNGPVPVQVRAQDLLGRIVGGGPSTAGVQVPACDDAVTDDAALVAALRVGVHRVAGRTGRQLPGDSRRRRSERPRLAHDTAAHYIGDADGQQGAFTHRVIPQILDYRLRVITYDDRGFQPPHGFGRVDTAYAAKAETLAV